MSGKHFRNWSDVYGARAREFDDPLDICEFYCADAHCSSAWFDTASNHIASALSLAERHSVLEVGCGCGVIMNHLKSRAARWTGVDRSPDVIDKARELLPDVEFVCASADHLPFAEGTFDAAFSYQVFHYFDSLEMAQQAVHELKRVVRPGGHILIGQVPDAAKYEACQAYRRSRGVSRTNKVDHDLQWLWYSKEFFEQFEDENCLVTIDQTNYEFDVNYQFRVDVRLAPRDASYFLPGQ